MAISNVTKDSTSISFPEYFTALAKDYARQTGNSTHDLFRAALDELSKFITPESIIHDNAAGPGTATSVLLEKYGPSDLPTTLVTDFNAAMISEAQTMYRPVGKVTAEDPLASIKEIHRTLQPGGTAAILTWKRFGVINVIHAAQALVRPDLPLMKLPHPEFLEEGYLAKMIVDAGFQANRVTVAEQTVVVKGENLEGITDFMAGGFTAPARNGWTEDEVKRWPDVLHEVVEREKEEFGGVKMEAWVVVARK